MKEFISVLLVLAQISVIVTTIQVYLRINKIWKRKHEQEVAESQSIVGIILLLGNCLLWICYYIWVETDMLSIIDTSLYMVESSVFLLIPTGLWVKGKNTLNIWQLAKSALRLERKESTYLLKKMFNISNAEIIISILHQIAMIDDNLDPKEREIIIRFANQWDIKYSEDDLNKDRVDRDSYNYIRLRDTLVRYLSDSPPKEQILHLRKLISEIIFVDNKLSVEEALIQDELYGIIDQYSNTGDIDGITYSVLIVPQHKDHYEVVESVIPNTVKVETAGGIAYSIGTYYSESYAEMMCEQYRNINLFTIVRKQDAQEMKQNGL